MIYFKNFTKMVFVKHIKRFLKKENVLKYFFNLELIFQVG